MKLEPAKKQNKKQPKF